MTKTQTEVAFGVAFTKEVADRVVKEVTFRGASTHEGLSEGLRVRLPSCIADGLVREATFKVAFTTEVADGVVGEVTFRVAFTHKVADGVVRGVEFKTWGWH